jgi:hypothetical protein
MREADGNGLTKKGRNAGMPKPSKDRKTQRSRFQLILVSLLALLVVVFVACGKQRETAANEKTAAAAGGSVEQKTFASPDAAGSAVFDAAKGGDQSALLGIFGPEAKDLLNSGDAVKDKNTLQAFANAYTQMHRWGKDKGGAEILYVGADNFPFPIPLQQNSSGQWIFNTAAGKGEILARRIGNGELIAIDILSQVADAQQEYFSQNHQYAMKFVSDQGEHNGLYWPTTAGERPSPLGTLGDEAKALGYSRSEKPQPLNGYYYKLLTQQGETAKGGAMDYMDNGKLTGGFAVLAWPAKYRDSGIMTFMLGPNGVVYQKDLGEKTEEAAAAITSFNPGEGWTVVLEPEAPGRFAGVKSAKK